jgi:hypothetical protein
MVQQDLQELSANTEMCKYYEFKIVLVIVKTL